MASFPDSVKTFTTKNTGDVIQAAHVNDLQDEVTAIEAGYRNGTAPIASSGSTFSVRPVEPPPVACRAWRNSTYAVASSVLSTLTFNVETYNFTEIQGGALHETILLPERMTVRSTGLYLATAQVTVATPSSGVRGLAIVDSSNGQIAGIRITNSTDSLVLNVSGYKRFDSTGGWLSAVFVGDGSTHSLSSGESATWFAVTKL